MDTFDSLQNRRERKIDEMKDSRTNGKKRLLQTIHSIDSVFRGLKHEDPEGYRDFLVRMLNEEIKVLEGYSHIEEEVLSREDVTVRGDIISQIHKIEDRIADINYYLQELAEGNPEPIEA